MGVKLPDCITGMQMHHSFQAYLQLWPTACCFDAVSGDVQKCAFFAAILLTDDVYKVPPCLLILLCSFKLSGSCRRFPVSTKAVSLNVDVKYYT